MNFKNMMKDIITAKRVKYIKLGRGGSYEEYSIKNGEIHLGFHEIAHEKCLNEESLREECEKVYHEQKKQARSLYANQLLSFYNEGEDTMWITFHKGKLYWCFAEKEVFPLSQIEEKSKGSRFRKTKNGWSCYDTNKKELKMDNLRGSLTKTAAFRSTICDIDEENKEYLLNRINGNKSPEIEEAELRKNSLLDSIEKMTKKLQPNDFELLVDLIFSKSGWQRTSVLGKTMKDTDINMFLPSTGEEAVVQVKSNTYQAELECYLENLSGRANKIFYVYHTGAIEQIKEDGIYLITGKELAEMIFNAGLFEWLFKKVC